MKASIAAGTLAVAPLTWWVSRPLFQSTDGDGSDVLIDPPALSGAVRLAIGLGAVVLVCNGVRALVGGLRSGQLRREWLGIVVPGAILAGYVGFTAAVATAPADGADTGAALLLLGLFVVLPMLITIGVVYGQRLRPPPARRVPPRLPPTS